MAAKTLPSSSCCRGAPLGNRNAVHLRQLIHAAADVDDFYAGFDLLRVLCLATGALPRLHP